MSGIKVVTNQSEISAVTGTPPGTTRPRTTHQPGDGLEIGVLTVRETRAALDVVARGMRDNPLHIAAFGTDPQVRLRKLHAMLSGVFAVKDLSHALVAHRADGVIVGVCGILPPGNCLPTPREKLRLLPSLILLGPPSLGRVCAWLGAWAKHDPADHHWHLGPLAIDHHLQGCGIGSKLMQVFSAQMDAVGQDAYLETDKLMNVDFYRRFGFEVIAEEEVLGVPNWFMRRRPARYH